MSKVKLADGLSLPLDVVTQTVAILAKRRAGKSYTMRRLVEQLFHAGQQIVILDPKGDQWGVRSAADGKGPGLPIVILGGERGDVPLEASGGEVVAKLVVEERVSVLLDVSLFRKHEVATFMTAFLENLYRLKAREIYRTPMMLVIDEADAIAPQKPQKGEERMLGAAEDIVRRGGQRGIGCVLVSQRSAVLNKNVLTQAQMLVALRTIAPQDLAAMNAWIDVHGTLEQKQTLMESLPSLPVGDAWFWSPGWPTADGIFKRVHVLPIETFDSGATPKSGEKRVEPKRAADVDLEALKRQMAATIEKARADDPRELRKQIAELKKELTKQGSAPVQTVANHKIVEKPVLTDADRALLTKIAAKLELIENEIAGAQVELLTEHLKSAEESLRRVWHQFEGIHQTERANFTRLLESKGFQKILEQLAPIAPAVPSSIGRPSPHTFPDHIDRRGVGQTKRAPVVAPSNGNRADVSLGKGERIILTAVAQNRSGVTREQLTVLTGYKRSSRDTYLQRLTAGGLVQPDGQFLVATHDGLTTLGAFEPLPTGDDLRTYWLDRLPEGERKILAALVTQYPQFVDRDALDDVTGYKRSSRDTYLQRLGARRLIDVERGTVRASQELFS
jgi:uncharacterized protein